MHISELPDELFNQDELLEDLLDEISDMEHCLSCLEVGGEYWDLLNLIARKYIEFWELVEEKTDERI